MENKLSDLRKCIARVAHVAGKHSWGIMFAAHSKDSRFVRLWQARNRRTRVLMARAGRI
jgi:hypothetical protein